VDAPEYRTGADFQTRPFDPPIFETLGGTVEEAGEGRSRLRFPLKRAFTIPGGFIQGGIQAALIDEGMIVAVMTAVPKGEYYTTVELKVNYLRPAIGESFTCESEVIRKGRTMIYVESSLKDDQGRLVARASSTVVKVANRAAAETPPPSH
jgi:uncharacterized protein (TIGR00369 family)